MSFVELPASSATAVLTAADHLAAGGLLAHPTTRSYGIGGAPEPAVERELVRLKSRSAKPGFIYLVADVAGLRRGFPDAAWTPLAARFAAAFWPGPLTLVLDDGTEWGVAVRAEAQAFTRAVLQRFERPLSSTSLNRTGEPAARESAAARDAVAALGAKLPVLLIDAGRLAGPPPSTLVRVRQSGEGDGAADADADAVAYEVLRPGAVEVARLEEVAGGPPVRRA